MVISKNELGYDSTHFIKLGLKTFIPDYLIKIKDRVNVDFTIKNSDCIFFIVDSMTVSLKPVGLKSVDSITYEDLKSINFAEFIPEFVYVFKIGTFDLNQLKDKYNI